MSASCQRGRARTERNDITLQGLKADFVAIAPYLRAQLRIEHDRFREPAADRGQCLRIAVAHDVDQGPGGEAKCAQAVQKDVIEAELACRGGVDDRKSRG